MIRPRLAQCAVILILLSIGQTVRAGFELTISISDPTSFNASQLQSLQEALSQAEATWESVVTGYQPGIALGGISISVLSGSTFADANVTSSVNQGGFQLSSTATVRINPMIIDTFASWDGSGPTPPNTEFQGVNYLDDILAHELGHALGIGTQWTSNQVYQFGTGQYTGAYGLAAYRAEFDPAATFIPVELAGSAGTQNSHWDQLMRSSTQEGNPANPWILDPRIGITDPQGRDLGLELMTGAIDPDFGEPFLSNTTVQSLRDLGFTVVPEPASIVLLAVGWLLTICRRMFLVGNRARMSGN